MEIVITQTKELYEKAVSRSQQRFFGMVRQAQKTGEVASPEVARVAADISKKDAKDFASTKHKGLPEKKEVKEGASIIQGGTSRKKVSYRGPTAEKSRPKKSVSYRGEKDERIPVLNRKGKENKSPRYASQLHRLRPASERMGKTKLKEEDTYSQKDKEIKKTKRARQRRFRDLHNKTNTQSNVDVNEDKSFNEFRLTLKTHDKLNPKIWTDKKLDPEIATNLVKIGKEWAKFAEIPENVIKDYIIVGGNANFNYTKYSDIDLHLVVDKKKLGCEGCLDDFLRAKKQLWALTHNITIKGHPVELYAQDVDETVGSKGQYSLKQKKWTQEPTPYTLNRKDPEVVKKVKDLIYQIDSLINAKSDDKVVFQNLKDKIGTMRKAAIQRAGEYAPENLVFKELRNRGYVEKVWNYLRDLGDKELSVEEVEIEEKYKSYKQDVLNRDKAAKRGLKTGKAGSAKARRRRRSKPGGTEKLSDVNKTAERKSMQSVGGFRGAHGASRKSKSAQGRASRIEYRRKSPASAPKKHDAESVKKMGTFYSLQKRIKEWSQILHRESALILEELEETTWSAMILLPSNKRRKVTFNAPSMSRKDALQIVKALYGATDVTQLNRLKYRRFKRVNEDTSLDEIYRTFTTKERKKMEDSEKERKEKNLRMKYGKNWKSILKVKNNDKKRLRPGEVKRLVKGKWVSNKD